MKLSIAAAVSLALAGSVGAANFCTQGLNYCSSTLRHGVDYDYYDPKLRAMGSQTILDDWLWRCGPSGQISLIERCSKTLGCRNGGVGQSDYCNTQICFHGVCGKEAQEGQEDLEDQEGQEE